MKEIRIKRIYEAPSSADGYRVLIDRLWPRGVSKEEAILSAWNKDIAPSAELRKWFDHDPDRFEGFANMYRKELESKEDYVEVLRMKAEKEVVTLLYGAKDTKHNHAVVLQQVLRK